jgi:hypothetical protein
MAFSPMKKEIVNPFSVVVFLNREERTPARGGGAGEIREG